MAWRWGHVAAVWSLLFAALHVFWAAGGSVGLAESAGADLAEQRPAWFVAFGLWGVAVALIVAAVLATALARGARPRRQRVGTVLSGLVAAGLLLRALAMEVVLLAVPGYGNGGVSRAERFWTLVLWDPWFLVGGVAFALAAMEARRRRLDRRPGRPR